MQVKRLFQVFSVALVFVMLMSACTLNSRNIITRNAVNLRFTAVLSITHL